MGTTPVFPTVLGPVITDYADGVAGFNGVAKKTEDCLDVWNAWAAKAEASFASTPPVTGIATAATGWQIQTGYASRVSWGRKWGGFTFINVCLLRTGATITVTEAQGGDITDTTLCTLIAGWRPPLRSIYVSAAYHSYAPCGVRIDTTGACVLYTMACMNVPFVNNRVAIVSALWANEEVPLYP